MRLREWEERKRKRQGDRQRRAGRGRVSLVLIEIANNRNNSPSTNAISGNGRRRIAVIAHKKHTQNTHNLLVPSLKLIQWRAKCAVRGPIEKEKKLFLLLKSKRHYNRHTQIGKERKTERQWHWSVHPVRKWKGTCPHKHTHTLTVISQVALATLAARLSDDIGDHSLPVVVECNSFDLSATMLEHCIVVLLCHYCSNRPPVRSFIEPIFSFGTIKDNYGIAMRISKLYTDAT